MKLEARIPSGPLAEKWQRLRDELKLVSPANKRKRNIIVVGTGLAGGAAATMHSVVAAVEIVHHGDPPTGVIEEFDEEH